MLSAQHAPNDPVFNGKDGRPLKCLAQRLPPSMGPGFWMPYVPPVTPPDAARISSRCICHSSACRRFAGVSASSS